MVVAPLGVADDPPQPAEGEGRVKLGIPIVIVLWLASGAVVLDAVLGDPQEHRSATTAAMASAAAHLRIWCRLRGGGASRVGLSTPGASNRGG